MDLTSSATKQCISIPIEDDAIDESVQECFVLSVSESSGNANVTVSPPTVTVCINDTDGEIYTMEPSNRGHYGADNSVTCREFPILEVK